MTHVVVYSPNGGEIHYIADARDHAWERDHTYAQQTHAGILEVDELPADRATVVNSFVVSDGQLISRIRLGGGLPASFTVDFAAAVRAAVEEARKGDRAANEEAIKRAVRETILQMRAEAAAAAKTGGPA